MNNLLILILPFCLFQKCDFAIPINDPAVDSSPISATCEISARTEGFCVPIHNCLALLKSDLTDGEKLARKCGSRNENRNKPKVCCEKSLIKLDNTPTSTEECGVQNIDGRLVGGAPADKKEYPWLSRLLRKDTFGELVFSCTGALISSKVVLTTAHCLISNSLVQLGELHAVALGEHEIECTNFTECFLNKKIVPVSKFLAHPDYDKTSTNHDNDIGLIFLKQSVQFTSYIKPICLLENDVEATEYQIAGWGKTESGKVSDVKLQVGVPPFSWQQCVEKYKSIKVYLTERQICAGGGEGVDTCQGDSGGPLMMMHNLRWHVAGVVSFGLSCGRKGWPGVYIYVPKYITWIKDNMRE